MEKAVSDVRNGKKIRKAAKENNVPYKTLYVRVKKQVAMTTRTGPKTVLTEAEEGQLETYLLYMADHGLPLRPREAGAFIMQLVKDRSVLKK